MEKTYYIFINGQQQGPFPIPVIKGMNLSPDTPVWTAGMTNWQPMSSIAELQPGFGATPPPFNPTQQPGYGQQGYAQGAQFAYQNNGWQQQNSPAESELSLWGYYCKCWKEYATFSGRARRKEFWGFTLFNAICVFVMYIPIWVSVLIQVLKEAYYNNDYYELDVSDLTVPIIFSVLLGLYSLAAIIPSLAVSSRRLHDTGRAFGWYFIGLIPLVGIILLLVWYCTDGERGANRFGNNPKGW